jgi:predicted MPP superfamily phosphohydrolase
MSIPTFSRRRFLQFMAGATLSGATAFAYVRMVEPHWVDVERVTLSIPDLAANLEGKRIVQFSDIHLSPFFSPEQLAGVVALTNRLAPDWVFLTGDYFSGGSDYCAALVEPLRGLEPPAFGVFGNHDVGEWRTYTQRYLDETPVRLLTNEGVLAAPGLWVAGVDDTWRGAPDLKRALRDKPEAAASLLLAHEPDYLDYVRQSEAPVDVQFSGHTHGGQIRVPTLGAGPDGNGTRALILPYGGQRYPIGLRTAGRHRVYTNRGLGVWPMPYRLNCRPELTLFTLTAA